MAKAASRLEWCVVRFGQDTNWWVEKVSDDIQWDIDGWGIIDPRQLAHIIDLLDPLREYGIQLDFMDDAFFKFRVESELGNNRVRLVRANDSIFETEEKLFVLPDILDEEKGPYADFLYHITKLRVKMLNDLIDFEQRLTVEELEEEIREQQQGDFMEGKATHPFTEITSILEYVPEGFELDGDEDSVRRPVGDAVSEEDFPDVDVDERIEEDETMRWDEEEGDSSEETEPTLAGGEAIESLDDDVVHD